MWTAIVSNRAERLVRPKEPVSAGESLDDVFIAQHLVQVKGVDPFGIKARQHLIHHNQQFNLLFRFTVNPLIGLFMRQTGGNVLFHLGKGCRRKVLAIPPVIIGDQFQQAILFDL